MNVASIIKMLAAVAWIAFFGLIFIVVLRASRNKNIKGAVTILVVTLCAAIVLSIVSAGLVFIKPEQRGVVISASSQVATALSHYSRVCVGSSHSSRMWSSIRSHAMPTPCPLPRTKVRFRGMIRSLPVPPMGRRSSWMLP